MKEYLEIDEKYWKISKKNQDDTSLISSGPAWSESDMYLKEIRCFKIYHGIYKKRISK